MYRSPITTLLSNQLRRASGIARFALLATFALFVLFHLRNSPLIRPNDGERTSFSPSSKSPRHPIDKLIAEADVNFRRLLGQQTHTVSAAAAAYRKRRGRHPPPHFDEWVAFAKEKDAVIVEDFFDQIYHDLEPFWGLKPATIRREAVVDNMVISVRNGEAHTDSDWFWTDMWCNLVKTIAVHLPDLDMPVNPMDESRLMVPWEDIRSYMIKAGPTRKLAHPNEVISEFQKLPPPGQHDLDVQVRDRQWETQAPYWDIARRGCSPSSLARMKTASSSSNATSRITSSMMAPHTEDGYIANYTLSADYCHQPDLHQLHGTMIQPQSISTSKVLSPLFGGSKLPTNNGILIPPAMQWVQEDNFIGKDGLNIAWAEKKNGVIWRGVASGGRTDVRNWSGFQRHRFMSMTNATKIAEAESGVRQPNFDLPHKSYKIASLERGRMAEWVSQWSNTGFIDLLCARNEDPEDHSCPYLDPHFHVVDRMSMSDQFADKYVPDIDGNSFSGRFRGFLLSGSLPIKATIYREWHDSRLMAWKHFVPMDNRFLDFFGIMQYFLGYKDGTVTIKSHDDMAEKIAREGEEWARSVLRPEDMQIYVYRLLLEYARVSDDRREHMGWIGDLR